MLTEFKGTFRDRFEGEKEYHITEDAMENGIFEYTVFCPFSNRSTTVQSRVKLDQVACNGCLRAYQIHRPQPIESAVHGVEAAIQQGAESAAHGLPAERAQLSGTAGTPALPCHDSVMAS